MCGSVEDIVYDQNLGADIDEDRILGIYRDNILPFLNLPNELSHFLQNEKVTEAINNFISTYYADIRWDSHDDSEAISGLNVQGNTLIMMRRLADEICETGDTECIGSLFVQLCMYRYYREIKTSMPNVFDDTIPELEDHIQHCPHCVESNKAFLVDKDPYDDLIKIIKQKLKKKHYGTKLILNAFLQHLNTTMIPT